jgi:transposase
MAYPSAFRQLVVMAYLQGEGSLAELADEYDVPIRTLHRWVVRAVRVSEFGPRVSPGRPRTLDASATETLRALLAVDNDATLPMLARALAQSQGIEVSVRTVGRALERLNVTRKKSRSTTRHNAVPTSRVCVDGSAPASLDST